VVKCCIRSYYLINVFCNPLQSWYRHLNYRLQAAPLIIVDLKVVEDIYLLSSVLAGDLES